MIDRDAIIGYIESHRPLLIRYLAGCLALLLVLLFVILYSESSAARKRESAETALRQRALGPDELWYLREPLPVPGVQLSREPRKSWSVEEMNMWYSTPDGEQLDKLRSAGSKQVDGLLESIP